MKPVTITNLAYKFTNELNSYLEEINFIPSQTDYRVFLELFKQAIIVASEFERDTK